MADTRSRYLASGAKWNDKVGDSLRAFLRDLSEAVEPLAPAEKAKRADLVQALGSLGIAPSSSPVILDQPFPSFDARPSFPAAAAPGRS